MIDHNLAKNIERNISSNNNYFTIIFTLLNFSLYTALVNVKFFVFSVFVFSEVFVFEGTSVFFNVHIPIVPSKQERSEAECLVTTGQLVGFVEGRSGEERSAGEGVRPRQSRKMISERFLSFEVIEATQN